MSEPAGDAGAIAASEVLIDWAHLDRQTAGDADLARELLALFSEQCRRLLPDLRRPDAERGLRADLAHTLKGSALGVGAVRVAGYAAIVEDALRQGTLEPVDALAALSDALERTLEAIEHG